MWQASSQRHLETLRWPIAMIKNWEGAAKILSISETATKMRKWYNRVQVASERCWVNPKEPFYWDSKCEFRVAEWQTRHCSWILLRSWPKPVTERMNKDEGQGSLSPPLCHPDPGERSRIVNNQAREMREPREERVGLGKDCVTQGWSCGCGLWMCFWIGCIQCPGLSTSLTNGSG